MAGAANTDHFRFYTRSIVGVLCTAARRPERKKGKQKRRTMARHVQNMFALRASGFRTLSLDSKAMSSVQLRNAEMTALRGRLVLNARRLVSNSATAEDLVQETLLAVCENRAPLRGNAAHTTWAVAILKNKAADWWRSPESRWVTSLESGDAGDSGGGPLDSLCRGCSQSGMCPPLPVQPDDALERRQLAASIARCTLLLRPLPAQAFFMHECMGFDTAEICERLNITPGNCRTLLRRAKFALRKCLGADWQAEARISAGPLSRSATEIRPI